MNERIKQLRLERGWSQVDLARKLAVSKQSVSNWENDNVLPSIEMMVKLSHPFSVSTDFLLGEDDRLYLEIIGLNQTQLTHVRQVVDDIRGN